MILVKDFSGADLEFGSPVYIGKCFNNHSLQASFRIEEDAEVTAVTYALLGSNDGVGWINLGSKTLSEGELIARTGVLFVIDKPISHVAVSIEDFTFTVGEGEEGNAFLTIAYEGY